jgi:hypothetical protein
MVHCLNSAKLSFKSGILGINRFQDSVLTGLDEYPNFCKHPLIDDLHLDTKSFNCFVLIAIALSIQQIPQTKNRFQSLLSHRSANIRIAFSIASKV